MRNVKTPRFQQRHYEYLADWIKRYAEDDVETATYAGFLIPAFKADNPRFDRGRFLRACVPDEPRYREKRK